MEPTAGEWDRVEPNNKLTHDLTTSGYPKSFVDVRSQNNQIIWTPEKLSPLEQEVLLEFCKTHAAYSNPKSVIFISGFGKYQPTDHTAITFTETEVQFEAHSNWSMYAVGSYTRSTPEEYAASITNKETPMTIEVKKVWQDEDDQDGCRPDSVDVTLLADGEEVGTKTLNLANGWSDKWEGLARTKDGKAIVYTLKEVVTDVITGKDGPGTYKSEVSGSAADGFVVKNTHTPETIEIEVSKDWDDADDNDGIRPASVEVQLYAGEEPADAAPITLNESNQWTGTWNDIPKYAEGEEVEYTVKETETGVITGEDGPGTYAYEVSGSAADGFVVKNTHTPETINIEVSKEWADKEDKDGIRPASVEVQLYVGEEPADAAPITLNESNQWTGVWEDMPKYADGKEIEYTVKETETDVITGKDGEGTYASEVTGSAADGFTVTNTHTPKTEPPAPPTPPTPPEDNPDPEKPASPKTGDPADMGLLIALMLLSAGALCSTLAYERRRK